MATGLCWEFFKTQRKQDCETVYARFDCEGACVRRLLRREICCLQHGETKSNVWNTFVWSCPTWPSRWGMHISIDWPRLKSCQAVCDECMRGEIYSSRDAGCSALWTWRDSRVTKIWGSEHDHGFVLLLFATTGFHIAWSGLIKELWNQDSLWDWAVRASCLRIKHKSGTLFR